MMLINCSRCRHRYFISQNSLRNFIKNKFYCNNCLVKRNPPKLLLTKLWQSESLYDPIKMKYPGKSLQYFLNCGFRVREHQENFNRYQSPTCKEYFVLEYMGKDKIACPLITKYKWPPGWNTCKVSCY